MTVTTKRCPGFAPGGIEPHELPADREHFASNAGNKDGLATRCKTCGNLYGKAWAAAKREGREFSARRPKAPSHDAEAPTGERTRGGQPDPMDRTQAAPAPQPTLRAGTAPGWGISIVAGREYPVPTSSEAVGSEQGQAALDRVNEARRMQARDQKRAERKRKAQEAASAQA